jgi:DNA adenine methylase
MDELENGLRKLNLSTECKKQYYKPLIKWIGGKTQIIQEVVSKFPDEIHNYYEPFAGGGSVFLNILFQNQTNCVDRVKTKINGVMYISDANKHLISVYKTIQTTPDDLINALENIQNRFLKIKQVKGNKKPQTEEESVQSQEAFYYWTRKQFNTCPKPELFIFLNKTCFRGVYRENKKKEFNVPFGNYKNPSIFNKEQIKELSKAFNNQKIVFETKDFSDVFNDILKSNSSSNETIKDFIYLDPPYYPEKENSFTAYTGDNFDKTQHIVLFEHLRKIKIPFVMSNSETKYVLDQFKDDGDLSRVKIDVISCKRSINSKKPEQRTNEIIAYLENMNSCGYTVK